MSHLAYVRWDVGVALLALIALAGLLIALRVRRRRRLEAMSSTFVIAARHDEPKE